jgi:hypothetical protein
MRLSFLVKDHGWAAFRKTFEELAKANNYVKVGVFGDSEKREGPIDNVSLAVLHEFGSPSQNIPERSFLRAPADANRAAYQAMLRTLIPDVLTGKRTIAKVLGLVGMKGVADVNAWVRQGSNLAPNAPMTIARKLHLKRGKKKSDVLDEFGRVKEGAIGPRPLIDTGRLLQSVTYHVVLDGHEQAGGK